MSSWPIAPTRSAPRATPGQPQSSVSGISCVCACKHLPRPKQMVDLARACAAAPHARAVSCTRHMTEFRVSSWNELSERLYAESWQAPLGRFRSHFAFRGISDATADLTTSLVRLGGSSARQEGHILRNFRKYAHRDAVPLDSVWNWLSLGQHHGLPTRLLDWSFSPYVAMHFATQDIGSFDVDGVIACIDYAAAHALTPARLKKMLRDEGADVFTAEMLDRVATTLPELDKLGARKPFVVFLEPPSLDDRIVNQSALFSLMSKANASLDEWVAEHPE